MRRVLSVTVTVGVVTCLMAGPAAASAPVHHHSASAAIEAFWQSKVGLPQGRFKLITWSVGVFPSTRGTFSFVFKEVAKCRMASGHRRCRLVSVSEGVRRSLTAGQFSFDRRHLESAHLDATYKLRTFLPGGKKGRTFTAAVVASWTGVGKLSHERETSTFHSGCLQFHTTFKGRHRSATATGSISGKPLGTAKQASLSAGTSLTIEHRC